MKINFVTRLLTDAEYDSASGNFLRKDLPAGSAEWSRDQTGEIRSLLFSCPCGCGVVQPVPVTGKFGGEGWQWNGREELPTLKPSILKTAGCRWHGFLTDGEWRTA